MSFESESDDPAFWAPRESFLPPIPELSEAANLLESAAEALLKDDLSLAGDLIEEADMPAIRSYYDSIARATSREVHRVRQIADAPPMAATRARQRMPGKRVERAVFERDGWRCRFCGVRVILKDALARLAGALPDVARWRGFADSERHAAFLALCSSLDHILPHSRGGTNDEINLVLACWPCQFGRNQWTLEEVGLLDPREGPPIVDGWDGLVRLCSGRRALGQQAPRQGN